MFTLIVCLAVVALSGAVVLRVVLGEEAQPATPPRPPQGRPSPVRQEAPAARQQAAPTLPAAAPARHRVRSAVVLVFLLTTVGSVLALVVAVTLSVLVTGVRAGLG